LYYTLIDTLNQDPEFELNGFVNKVEPSMANSVTTMIMNDERYRLHDWNRMNIFPKEKHKTIAQLVSETILSLRCFLIEQKVSEFKKETLDNRNDVNKGVLDEVMNYSNLKMLLSRKLNRVL
jgi:DNA primase